jgi:hypothetical protein
MLAAVTGARRILAFDQDEGFLEAAGRLLGVASFQFLAVRDPAQVRPRWPTRRTSSSRPRGAGTAFAQERAVARFGVPWVFVLADGESAS